MRGKRVTGRLLINHTVGLNTDVPDPLTIIGAGVHTLADRPHFFRHRQIRLRRITSRINTQHRIITPFNRSAMRHRISHTAKTRRASNTHTRHHRVITRRLQQPTTTTQGHTGVVCQHLVAQHVLQLRGVFRLSEPSRRSQLAQGRLHPTRRII